MKCNICQRYDVAYGMCEACGKVYDRDLNSSKNDGTIEALIDWAASRCWQFARAEIKRLQKSMAGDRDKIKRLRAENRRLLEDASMVCERLPDPEEDCGCDPCEMAREKRGET